MPADEFREAGETGGIVPVLPGGRASCFLQRLYLQTNGEEAAAARPERPVSAGAAPAAEGSWSGSPGSGGGNRARLGCAGRPTEGPTV